MDLTPKIDAVRVARATQVGHLRTMAPMVGPLMETGIEISQAVNKAEQDLAVSLAISEVQKFLETQALELLFLNEPNSGAQINAIRTLLFRLGKNFQDYKVPADLIEAANKV